LRFCLDHLNCFKMAAFLFYLESGKHRSTTTAVQMAKPVMEITDTPSYAAIS
jgi:hypothetical protein